MRTILIIKKLTQQVEWLQTVGTCRRLGNAVQDFATGYKKHGIVRHTVLIIMHSMDRIGS